jgi:deoxyadenosine/deoxycytidine kinase
MDAPKKIGVVGPCSAGKSALIAGLKERGYFAKHIAQEHSYIAEMWQKISNPDLLIYLDVSFEIALERRWMNWTRAEFEAQCKRLRHARSNAHFYLHTDPLSSNEVLKHVMAFLKDAGIEPDRS